MPIFPRSLLLPLLLGAAPAAMAQAPERLTLTTGLAVQVQVPGDTTWQEADLVEVGGCTAVTIAVVDRRDDGFVARPFAGIAALRVIDNARRWHQLGAGQLAELRACQVGIGPVRAIAAECGADPELARGNVFGVLAGIRSRGATGQPTDDLIGVNDSEVTAVDGAARCRDILAHATPIAPDADTIPLSGIMQVGSAGFMIVRFPAPLPPGTAGARWATTIFLDTDLVVRTRIDQRL